MSKGMTSGAMNMPFDNDLQRIKSFSGNNRLEFGQYDFIDYDDEMIEEIHLEWKSLKKTYFVEFINEYGDPDIKQVSEDFHIPDYAQKVTELKDGVERKIFYFDDQKVYEAWVEETWQGVKLGTDTFVDIKPKEYQFRSIDDPYTAKLGYIGNIYSNMNAPAVSLMDRMKSFIYLYILVAHRLKEFIAQDRAPLTHVDITMIDPKLGIEKTMYYMDQLNIDFYNPLINAEKPGAHARGGKVTGTSERSTMSHINNYISLLAALDDNISDVAGITRQREGQTSLDLSVPQGYSLIAMSSLVESI